VNTSANITLGATSGRTSALVSPAPSWPQPLIHPHDAQHRESCIKGGPHTRVLSPIGAPGTQSGLGGRVAEPGGGMHPGGPGRGRAYSAAHGAPGLGRVLKNALTLPAGGCPGNPRMDCQIARVEKPGNLSGRISFGQIVVEKAKDGLFQHPLRA